MTDQINYSEKIAAYNKTLSQDPKSMVFVPLAACYLKAGMVDDALETALKGTWELPDYSPGFVAVARVYAFRQVPEKAIAAFEKAINMDPSCLDAYKGLARVYREQGNIDAAANLLTNAVFLFPDESSLKLMLESLVPVEPVTEQVVEPVPTAVQSAASKSITTATIAEIYIKQGLYEKALEVYRELYAETQSSDVAQKIAEIESLAQGNVDNTTPVEPNKVETAPSVEPVVATETSGDSRPLSGQSVLDTLNGMLTSIQSRRNRV
jgi:tetratricopeptide (TPR) repeat protein